MSYHRILVPFDASPPSQRALDEAIRLAKDMNARLRLVHVMDELDWTNGYESAAAYVDEVLPRMRQSGENLLAAACRKAAQAQVESDSSLFIAQLGRVWHQVVEECVRWQADLVVAGTHGRHGVDRLLTGSAAEEIVRRTPVPVPVLVVRAADAPATAAS